MSAWGLRFYRFMKNALKCYISGRHLPCDKKRGIVSFAVPDFGILFRSLSKGERTDLELVALFSFLRFAAHNEDVFSGRELLIHTDYRLLAYMMNHGGPSGKGCGTLRREAVRIAGNLHFRIVAISPEANRAVSRVTEIPRLPADTALKIKTFAGLSVADPLKAFSIGPDTKSR